MSEPLTSVENVQTSFEMNFVAGSVKSHMKNINSGRSDTWRVPVGEIKVLPGFNPRIQNEGYEAHISTLTALIKANGFRGDRPLSGVVLKLDGKEELFIYDGHCRLAATKLAIADGAEIEHLPVVIAPKGTTLEDITAEVVNSSVGKSLSPLEVGVICKRLVGYGWAPARIAQRLSITVVYVDQLLTVVGSPLKIREMIQAGEVSLSTALEALRKHGDKAVEVLSGSLDVAQKSGKSRVTAAMLPGGKRKAVIRKVATDLHDVARRITEDPAFNRLSEDVRGPLMALLARIKEAEPEEGSSKEGELQGDAQRGEVQASAKVIPFAA